MAPLLLANALENPPSISAITADFADDVRGGHAHPMFDFVTAAQPNAGFSSCYGSRHGLTDRYYFLPPQKMGTQPWLACPFFIPLPATRVREKDYGLTLSFSDFPGLKATVLLALILTGSPVCGFLPVRAPRWRCRKVPKPTSVTLSLRCRAPVISSRTALRTRLACSLVRSAFSAMAAASSGLRI